MKKLFLILFAIVVFASLFPAETQAAGLVPCGGEGEAPCSLCHTFVLGNNILNFFLVPSAVNPAPLVLVAASLLFAIGGFFYFISAGNASRLDKGKQIITATIIGLLIIYGAWLFVSLLLNSLGVVTWDGIGGWWKIDCPIPLAMSLAGPASVIDGNDVLLEWTVFGGPATTCEAFDDWGGLKDPFSSSETLFSVAGIGTTKKYTLECKDSGGDTVSDSVSVSVVACGGPDATCYQRPIAVNNPSGAKTNYQVKVVLDTASLIAAGKMRSDCGDLRVTNSDGTSVISHWIENGCNTPTTNIWTKVPSLPTGNKDIYAFYGNSSAVTTSNFTSVFPKLYKLTTGNADFSSGPQSFDWFEIEPGTTFSITDGTPQVITARKIVIAGLFDGLGRGYAGGNSGRAGEGPGGGTGGPNLPNTCGGGGGYGGAGGNGGCGSGGGPQNGSETTRTIDMGSGGGNSDPDQAPAGSGGGAVIFNATELVISGTVRMDGGTRGTGTNENGGGSGGGILIQASHVHLAGSTLSAKGGNGEIGTVRTNGAGGGGGGRIKIFYEGSFVDSSSKRVEGGDGSTGGPPPNPGQDGAPGTIHTGTFTSPEPTATVGPEI